MTYPEAPHNMKARASTDRKPVILHLIDTTGPGGAETVFVELVDASRKMGYQPLAVIKGPGWVQENLEKRGIPTRVIPVESGFAIGFLKALIGLVREYRVCLIQAHLLGSSLYAAIVGLITRVPVVSTFHGMVDIQGLGRLTGLKKALLKAGSTQFVAVSKRLKEDLAQQGFIDPERTEVIYNGVRTGDYTRKPTGRLKERLGLPEEAILVGSLGNIRPAKNYEVLIQVAERVKQVLPNAHFVVAGHMKEPLMGRLEQLAEQAEVSDRVHFIGFQAESQAFLSELDLFLLTSSSEGFSISTIEAMASGLPVIATRSGGPEEIIEEGVSGLLANVGDSEGLANAVCAVLEDMEKRKRLSAGGADRVRTAFDMEKMSKAYGNLYNKYKKAWA